jgi:hypothetical protein
MGDNLSLKVSVQHAKTKESLLASTLLNVLIVGLAILVIYLSYGLVSRLFLRPPVEVEKTQASGKKEVIQVNVLNGCGGSGVAIIFMDYLRRRGYDVVETGNYTSFDVASSIVIDRRGDFETAKKIAYALGISNKNVVQQISPDYYLDVSVVIGRDYDQLKPMK